MTIYARCLWQMVLNVYLNTVFNTVCGWKNYTTMINSPVEFLTDVSEMRVRIYTQNDNCNYCFI